MLLLYNVAYTYYIVYIDWLRMSGSGRNDVILFFSPSIYSCHSLILNNAFKLSNFVNVILELHQKKKQSPLAFLCFLFSFPATWNNLQPTARPRLYIVLVYTIYSTITDGSFLCCCCWSSRNIERHDAGRAPQDLSSWDSRGYPIN